MEGPDFKSYAVILASIVLSAIVSLVGQYLAYLKYKRTLRKVQEERRQFNKATQRDDPKKKAKPRITLK